MASVISRNPVVFMKVVVAVCQLESSVGRTVIMLSKEKEKDKPKFSNVELGLSSNECVRIHENKYMMDQESVLKATKRSLRISLKLLIFFSKLC